MEREKRFPVAVAARRLGISDRTLRDWIKARLVRAVRLNPNAPLSPYLVPESEIERVERAREEGGAA